MRRVRHILSILRNIFAAAFHKVQAQPARTVEVQSANPLRTQFASRSRTQTVLRFDAQACHKLRTLAVRPVLALALTAVLVLASCERRPLEEMSNTHYVRVYVTSIFSMSPKASTMRATSARTTTLRRLCALF